MEEYSGYVGLDVHKDTIAVAVAYPGRSKPETLGVIANTKKSILNLVHQFIDSRLTVRRLGCGFMNVRLMWTSKRRDP